MSSLLFDTNALVYWVYPDSPFHEEVSALLHRQLKEEDAVYALSSSLNEVYYALHTHYMDEGMARDCIRDIAGVFDLIELTGPLVFGALDSNEPDYEDGLIRAAAEALQVRAIISYDRKAFAKSFVPKLTASEALEMIF